ncbi:B3 domain-containing protein, partial [Trifolium pratense]
MITDQAPPTMASTPSSSSSSSKLCFNSDCKDFKSENRPKKGWRLRSGDLAQLCDRCG